MPRLIVMVLLVCSSWALAVNTSHWVHTSETDFSKGTAKNVVVTNHGDVRLSRVVKTLVEQDPQISAVYSLAEGPDGAIYAGTGPHGMVIRLKDGKRETIYQSDDVANVFALQFDSRGRLLMGLGGEKGRILRLATVADKAGKPEEVFAAEGVQYVWAIAQTADGNLYAATGPNGQVFAITPDGKSSVLLDTDENNILCLISDGKDTLYAGTDPGGLVYRVNRKTGEAFVMFDAPEAEISALALDKRGNLFAATAEASEHQGRMPGGDVGGKDKSGRPEGTGGVPIPAQPPEMPKPPALPDPNPGEPNPIPKKPRNVGRVDSMDRSYFVDDHGPAPAPNPPNPHPTPGKPGPGQPNPPGTNPSNPAPQPPGPEPLDFGKPRPEGNAIYRIDPDGFVREVFRQNVMVLAMIERDGVLVVGTGSEGLVYEVNPAAEETSAVAKVDPKQVLALLTGRDGRIILGLANSGGVAVMTAGHAAEGTFVSPVLDATQISRFGKIHLTGQLPDPTSMTIATRSGNVQDPQHPGWSAWSNELPASAYVQISSPSARFLQYRLTFKTKSPQQTPLVSEIDLAYQMPNLPPVIKSVRIGSEAPKAGGFLALPDFGIPAANPAAKAPAARNPVEAIAWEAEEPNGDAMSYSLYYRSGSKAPWILMKEKSTETRFDWDTRGVADGRYEIKIIASDAAANPPGQGKTVSRVSDPIIVDNTAPVIGELKAEAKSGRIHVTARLADRTTALAGMEYSVDSSGDWQAVLPSDSIFDSPEETVDFWLPRLAPGLHQITLRCSDAKGNVAHESVLTQVDAPAGKTRQDK